MTPIRVAFLELRLSACTPGDMRRVAFVGQKGGSGKSTLAIATAVEAMRRNLRVVIVDLDRQGTCRDFGAAARQSGTESPPVVSVAPEDVDEIVSSLSSSYDLAVIDTPGRESSAGRSALMLCDLAVIPVQPSPADLWASAETFTVCRKAVGVRPELVVRPLVSRADARRRFSKDIVQTLCDAGMQPLETVIHDRADFPASMAMGCGPTVFAPEGKAAEEARHLVDEIFALLNIEPAEDHRAAV